MWDREILKSNARVALTGRYWMAYVACLIVSLITDAFDIVEHFYTHPDDWILGTQGYIWDYWRKIQSASDTTGLDLLSFLLWIFVGLPLVVGLARYFVQNRFGVTDVRTIFSGFQRSYGNTLGSMFVTYLFVGLWTLLLIVPGIIKRLEYSMVPFILSDNPSMPGSRARQISSMMTNGEKGSVFVLYLSFLGWYFLALLTIGVTAKIFWPISALVSAVVFPLVTAYQKATFAELYIFMRDRAIQSCMVQPAEFGLVPPSAQNIPPVM